MQTTIEHQKAIWI